MHGKRILKLLQKIFSWLPLATIIDQKVVVLHGGISNTTDLNVIARMDRHKYVSCLRPPKKRNQSLAGMSVDSDSVDDVDVLATYKALVRRASHASTNTNTANKVKPLGGHRDSFHNRSLQDLSPRVAPKLTVEEEFEVRRRQAGLRTPGFSHTQEQLNNNGGLSSSSDAALESTDVFDSTSDEWKQILDLLWSDPMNQDGCVPNEVRGGGCYWGPDVTEEFLSRHHLQFIIRSHECKQEGYEFCHNRKVITLFSASNYYEEGSNRGAYIRIGPDLLPHVVQYQASSLTRELTVKQGRARTEHSALTVLREQLFAHKSDLIGAFQKSDKDNTGQVSLNDWASAVESVMHLGLPWRMLRTQLVTNCKTSDGMLNYNQWFDELSIKEPSTDHIENSLLETLYKHRSTLETIFRVVDKDNSGFISMEDFRQTWKLLSVYLKMEITDKAIQDLAVSIDSNRDGRIDIDEFMEAFRLTDKKSRMERGRSMFVGTTPDLTLLEGGDPNV